MDTLAVQELRQAVEPLLTDTTSHLVFDLATVEYVSSSVLSFLMTTQGRAQEKGGKVSLVGASDLVRQVFEMASLDSLFDFRAKLEDLGIVHAPAPAKGKEKASRKEKVVPLNETKASPPPTKEARVPERDQAVPVSGQERREARAVEKLHPLPERGSWKDYGVWIGIGVLVLVSVAVSAYLYLQR